MQPYLSHHHARTAGMTLVETLVALSLFVILSLVVFNGVASFYRYNAYTIAQAYQVEHARRGVEALVRDLREMTFADNGAFPIVATATSSVQFFSDIDRDDSVELVEYVLEGSEFYKYVYNATGTPPSYQTSGTPDQTFLLSEYVQNIPQDRMVFQYYDENGDLVSPGSIATDVRYIDVFLVINIDPVRDPGEFMLRSSASLRNLKESL